MNILECRIQFMLQICRKCAKCDTACLLNILFPLLNDVSFIQEVIKISFAEGLEYIKVIKKQLDSTNLEKRIEIDETKRMMTSFIEAMEEVFINVRHKLSQI